MQGFLGRHIIVLSGLLAFFAAAAASAGVYKWRDAQGNLHFSDRPPSGDEDKGVQGAVKQVELHDAYGDVAVATKVPIRNARSDGGPAIDLSRFVLKLDATGSRNVTVGRAFYGKQCEQSTDLLWNDGMLDLKGRVPEVMVADRFKQAGYRLSYEDSAVGLASYTLEAELVNLKLDTCTSANLANKGAGSRAYVKLRWTLKHSSAAEPLFRGTGEGAHNGWGTADDRSILKAMGKAADNLLGDSAFVNALAGAGEPLAAVAPATELLTVAFDRGRGESSFRERSDALLAEAVTIETSRGHGSGVVIDASGYVLTNSHVVGQERTVQVLVGGKSVSGTVVRRDAKVDAALIRLTLDGLSAASVAPREPKPGDPLYVVGTPLSLKLSHTVTQGILSAVRDEGGRRLFQTDAAINPGNSGGPVFDASGDLVALSVASLVSAQGASLNVNYLIPIGEALKALGVSER